MTYLLVEPLIQLLQKCSPGVFYMGVDFVKRDGDFLSSVGVDEAAITVEPFFSPIIAGNNESVGRLVASKA